MLEVTPYMRFDGIPTFRDSEIASFYDRMVKDGTAKAVFYDRSVRNRDEFVRFMKDSLLFVALEDKKPIALGWVNRIAQRTGFAHFCFFKEVWGRSVEVGRVLVERVLLLSGLDMLVGMTPNFNKMALRFVENCGGKVLGDLPFGCVKDGESHGTTFFYYARGENHGRIAFKHDNDR